MITISLGIVAACLTIFVIAVAHALPRRTSVPEDFSDEAPTIRRGSAR